MSEPLFLQMVISGINPSAWVDNHITLVALEDAVRRFDAVRKQFADHVAPVDYITLARIVWMCSQSERTTTHWNLTRHALDIVGLNRLAIQMEGGATYQDAINVIRELYDSAMNEIWHAPIFNPQQPIKDSHGQEGAESEEAAAEEEQEDQEPNEDDADHVTEVDGMRKIKHNHLALALRDHTAKRGANDDELRQQNLTFECPYFCKSDGTATLIDRASNMTRHMQSIHDRPRGFRVTIVDTVGKQYQMAGSGGAEVRWKLVPRA